ncbi:macrolide ABC transporter ATP-binding protein [Actinorhabdospora filicis]|uniref:Macrolide ABC transporter ATP-binding protein n=1 Tax=Actinorhabdospora filicis TaxID=1785913 RepID=A0A9W6W354_9ACTN|nr:ABC transporter ATP-binding protein [Actinorhabdospora filicis]GLZ77752.1 macrolide ABC transporter ATP-binding protein [Actinorhabdospora filicis]
MITVTGLRKTYPGAIAACDGVDLTVARGEVVALTGPSGSGKSTLLHLIGALDTPDEGVIEVGDVTVTSLRRKDLAGYRRSVGFVFQRFHLLPALTALENVLAPLVPYDVKRPDRERARCLLDAVGLKDRADALPSKLSGGQQQRVAVARALVGEPGLLLADEPTGNLDSATGEEIAELLLGLREERGTTLVIATHDEGFAGRCDRVVRVRDGRLG